MDARTRMVEFDHRSRSRHPIGQGFHALRHLARDMHWQSGMTLSRLPYLSDMLSRAHTSLKVRITWAPFTVPLQLEALEVDGVALAPPATFFGGEVEFSVPAQLLTGRPRLRWVIGASADIDETRIEVCDAAGRWHLLGEILGHGEERWSGDRPLHGGLPLWGNLAAAPCKNAPPDPAGL